MGHKTKKPALWFWALLAAVILITGCAFRAAPGTGQGLEQGSRQMQEAVPAGGLMGPGQAEGGGRTEEGRPSEEAAEAEEEGGSPEESREAEEESGLLEEAGGLEKESGRPAESPAAAILEEGWYTSREEVALYLHLYGRLPDNYITKKEAEELGWDSRKGNLQDVAPGMSIGGSRFGNYEGMLPKKRGRQYYECDINYEGGYRGPDRLIYSNDGLVFYTGDHYKTFEQLY